MIFSWRVRGMPGTPVTNPWPWPFGEQPVSGGRQQPTLSGLSRPGRAVLAVAALGCLPR